MNMDLFFPLFSKYLIYQLFKIVWRIKTDICSNMQMHSILCEEIEPLVSSAALEQSLKLSVYDLPINQEKMIFLMRSKQYLF